MKQAGRGSLAVFPGSFDPITNGHLDIIARGLSVFDDVTIAILVNPGKQALFTVEERVEIIREAFRGEPRVKVDTFSGLLVDYAERAGAAGIEVFQKDARMAVPALRDRGERFDVVYLDPPYGSDLYEPMLPSLETILAEDGVIVAEHFHKRLLPERMGGLVNSRSVRVGDHKLTFYRR